LLTATLVGTAASFWGQAKPPVKAKPATAEKPALKIKFLTAPLDLTLVNL
jgi:hypothetical protein